MLAQVQKSYNWVYGIVRSSARMLPYLERSLAIKPQFEATATTLGKYKKLMQDGADDLASLAEYLDCEQLRDAERHLRRTISGMDSCIDACGNSESSRLAVHLRGVVAGLEQTLSAMRGQSQVQYRLWFLNPWRYYPRRLGAHPLPRGPKGLR